MVRQRAPKRRTRWVDTLVQSSVNDGSQTRVSLMSGLSNDAIPGMTVVRTILCYSVSPNSHSITDGTQSVDIGIGSFGREAAAAGVVADPKTESDFPTEGWVYRCRHMVVDRTNVEPVFYPEVRQDLRAMRRMGDDEELYLVVDNNNIALTPFAVLVHGIIRTLYKQA